MSEERQAVREVDVVTLAYDMTLRRPGCVLIQVALGATADVTAFPSEQWLDHYTDDMRVYRLSRGMFAEVVAMHRASLDSALRTSERTPEPER